MADYMYVHLTDDPVERGLLVTVESHLRDLRSKDSTSTQVQHLQKMLRAVSRSPVLRQQPERPVVTSAILTLLEEGIDQVARSFQLRLQQPGLDFHTIKRRVLLDEAVARYHMSRMQTCHDALRVDDDDELGDLVELGERLYEHARFVEIWRPKEEDNVPVLSPFYFRYAVYLLIKISKLVSEAYFLKWEVRFMDHVVPQTGAEAVRERPALPETTPRDGRMVNLKSVKEAGEVLVAKVKSLKVKEFGKKVVAKITGLEPPFRRRKRRSQVTGEAFTGF